MAGSVKQLGWALDLWAVWATANHTHTPPILTPGEPLGSPATVALLTAFQDASGLGTTGEADAPTLAALRSLIAAQGLGQLTGSWTAGTLHLVTTPVGTALLQQVQPGNWGVKPTPAPWWLVGVIAALGAAAILTLRSPQR